MRQNEKRLAWMLESQLSKGIRFFNKEKPSIF